MTEKEIFIKVLNNPILQLALSKLRLKIIEIKVNPDREASISAVPEESHKQESQT